MGEDNVPKAKSYAKVVVIMGACVSFVIMILATTLRRYIAMIYTDDEELIEYISRGIIYVAVYTFVFDAI